MPPEVAAYLKGAPPESRQFDFLIGDWDITGTRYKEDGSVLFQYKGSWSAKYMNDGRMVVDDFKLISPSGQEISSFVTLRTYSEQTRRWEMTGLQALQPASISDWHGEFKNGEMLLGFAGKDPKGHPIRCAIRFFNIEKSRFNWEIKTSFGDGKTWGGQSGSLTATRAAR